MSNTKSIGEKRVRTEFNPSNNDLVSQIKQKSAELINLIEAIEDKDDEEFERPKHFATYEAESAAMFAVKAATF